MEILLHICCAPCLIYPFSRLKKSGFGISGFYYNPNIYPVEEYQKRKETLMDLNKRFKLEVEYPQYLQADFSQAIDTVGDTQKRCVSCWNLRLQKTARQAKKKNIPAFSTTLLVSPYQDHELLKQIGNKIAAEEGLDFYYEDFRIGFKQAQTEAKNMGLYRQKYCGCRYSIKPKKK